MKRGIRFRMHMSARLSRELILFGQIYVTLTEVLSHTLFQPLGDVGLGSHLWCGPFVWLLRKNTRLLVGRAGDFFFNCGGFGHGHQQETKYAPYPYDA